MSRAVERSTLAGTEQERQPPTDTHQALACLLSDVQLAIDIGRTLLQAKTAPHGSVSPGVARARSRLQLADDRLAELAQLISRHGAIGATLSIANQLDARFPWPDPEHDADDARLISQLSDAMQQLRSWTASQAVQHSLF